MTFQLETRRPSRTLKTNRILLERTPKAQDMITTPYQNLIHTLHPPNVPLMRAILSLLDGIWGLLKGRCGVLDHTENPRSYTTGAKLPGLSSRSNCHGRSDLNTMPRGWVAVKELKISYHTSGTIVFTLHQ